MSDKQLARAETPPLADTASARGHQESGQSVSHTAHRASARRYGWLSVLLTVPLLVSCGGVASPSDVTPAGMGVLSGTVSRGPLTSIGGVGVSSAPIANAKVILSTPGGGPEVRSTATDAAGHYQVSLPSGSYLVTIGSVESSLFSKDLPASVTVSEGQTTTLDVMLDTGIR